VECNDAMYEFLSQFKPEENWAIREADIKDTDLLNRAKEIGFVNNWKPKKGCTYYPTALCTLKGRLYMRKNEKLRGKLK